MSSLPSDRCGYVHDDGWGKDHCCFRETWEDHEQCIWHADVLEKQAEELERAINELDSLERTDRSTERLDGAILTAATLNERISFRGCRLTAANFSGATLQWSDHPELEVPWEPHTDKEVGAPNFEYADLRGADFTDCDLPKASFRSADLRGSSFQLAGLANANLTDADLQSAICTNAYLGGAILRGAVLPETDFTATRLTSADLRGAFAEKAIFDRTDLSGADLRGASLYISILSNARVNERTTFGDTSVYDPSSEYYPPEIPDETGVRDFGTDDRTKAIWVYNRLGSLYEENGMVDAARRFHVEEKETIRSKFREDGEYGEWAISTVNRALTNHGVSLRRVARASAVVILSFSFLYPFAGGIEDGQNIYQLTHPLDVFSVHGIETLLRGLYFSVITFTTIGYANVAPHGIGSRVLVGVESLLGAILIALFVYVLGRRTA